MAEEIPTKRTPALLFNAYVEFAKIGLSNVFLINAGSATALIAFLGSTLKETGTRQAASPGSLADGLLSNGGASWAVKCFAIGAFLAILGTAALSFQENWNSDRVEKGWRPVAYLGTFAAIFLIGSAGAFLVGCFGAVK